MTYIDITIISIYFCLSIFVAIRASAYVKTMREYAISSQNHPTAIAVIVVFAAWTGGGVTLGFAQQAFISGSIVFLYALGHVLCYFIIARYLAPRFAPFHGMISVGDILATRYGLEGKVIAGLAGMCTSVIILGIQFMALAYSLEYFCNIPYPYGLIISLFVTLMHSSLGGLRSIAAVNTLQCIGLILAIPLISHIAINSIGGLEVFFHAITVQKYSLSFSDSNAYIFLIFLIPILAPTTVQRLLMAKDTKQRQQSFYAAGLFNIPFLLSICIIGIVAYVSEPNLSSIESILYIADTVLPSGIRGLAITSLFAIIISAASSHMHSASICCVHDVLKPLKLINLNDRQELICSIVATFFMGVCALVFALNSEKIVECILTSWELWVCLISVPLYTVLFKLNTTKTSFTISIIKGLGIFTIWYLTDISKHWGISNWLAGFFCNGLTMLYFAHKPQRFSYKILKDLLPTSMSFLKFFQDLQTNTRSQLSTLASTFWTLNAVQTNNFQTKHILFSSFAIFTFIFPYFVWSEINVENTLSLSLWLTGGLLCGIILVKDYWSQSMQRYFPLFWQFTLLYCLPFLNTYMVLENHAASFWLVNLGLSLFLLAAILHWSRFLLFITIGVGAGVATFKFTQIDTTWPFETATLFLFFYLIMFSSIIGLFSSRNHINEVERKKKTLKALSAAIAHEMRTPLSGLQLGISGLSRYLPNLLHGYKLAQNAGLTIPEITNSQMKMASCISQNYQSTIQEALLTIDMVLIKLRDPPKNPKQLFSISKCIEESLKAYPFMMHERTLVHWKAEEDFVVLGHPEYIQHIFFNLLKNSLHHINKHKKGTITIWLSQGIRKNHVHFKDTACGIPTQDLPHLFDDFNQQAPHANGTSLSFCKQVMANVHGNIECKSVHTKYAQFILKFPQTTV